MLYLPNTITFHPRTELTQSLLRSAWPRVTRVCKFAKYNDNFTAIQRQQIVYMFTYFMSDAEEGSSFAEIYLMNSFFVAGCERISPTKIRIRAYLVYLMAKSKRKTPEPNILTVMINGKGFSTGSYFSVRPLEVFPVSLTLIKSGWHQQQQSNHIIIIIYEK